MSFHLYWDFESSAIPMEQLHTFRSYLTRKGIVSIAQRSVFVDLKKFALSEDLYPLVDVFAATFNHSMDPEFDIQECVLASLNHRQVIISGAFEYKRLLQSAVDRNVITMLMPAGSTCKLFEAVRHRHYFPANWRRELLLQTQIQNYENLVDMEEQKEANARRTLENALAAIKLCKETRCEYRQAIWKLRDHSDCSDGGCEDTEEDIMDESESEQSDGDAQSEETEESGDDEDE